MSELVKYKYVLEYRVCPYSEKRYVYADTKKEVMRYYRERKKLSYVADLKIYKINYEVIK